mgnify:CR=1 FL=1
MKIQNDRPLMMALLTKIFIAKEILRLIGWTEEKSGYGDAGLSKREMLAVYEYLKEKEVVK